MSQIIAGVIGPKQGCEGNGQFMVLFRLAL